MTSAAQYSLPAVGTPTEKLLREFSEPFLLALAKDEQTRAAHDLLKAAQGSLRSAWEARRMSERLVGHAEGSLEAAELAAESAVRSLFDGLQASAALRGVVFPHGPGAAVAPRGHAQVRAIERLDDLLGTRADLPVAASTARIQVIKAGLALSIRLRALEVEEARLAEAQRLELAAERHLRRSAREITGILSGLFYDAPQRRASFLPPGPRIAWPALPRSPTPPPPKPRQPALKKAQKKR